MMMVDLVDNPPPPPSGEGLNLTPLDTGGAPGWSGSPLGSGEDDGGEGEGAEEVLSLLQAVKIAV